MTEKDRTAPCSMSEAKRLVYQMDPQRLAKYLCELRETMDRKDAQHKAAMDEAVEIIRVCRKLLIRLHDGWECISNEDFREVITDDALLSDNDQVLRGLDDFLEEHSDER